MRGRYRGENRGLRNRNRMGGMCGCIGSMMQRIRMLGEKEREIVLGRNEGGEGLRNIYIR